MTREQAQEAKKIMEKLNKNTSPEFAKKVEGLFKKPNGLSWEAVKR